MLFKKMAIVLLVLGFAFAIIVGACGKDVGGTTEEEQGQQGETIINYASGDDALDWGVSGRANVLTLGLNPGNDNTEINLNWYSAGAAAGKVAEVRFIRGTLTNGKELINKTGEVSDASIAGSTSNTAHKVTVNGLKAGESYQYAVSSDGEHWTAAYDFKVPAAGAFKFAVVADPQLTTGNVDADSRYPATGTTTAAGWVETMMKIVSANVSFIAFCGDQVDAVAPSEAEYTNFFAPVGLRNLPFAPTPGNHDPHLPYNYHYNWPNAQEFANETLATVKGRNYFYLYNNVLFVVLNTAPYPTASGNTSSNKDVALAKEHVARFESTIKAAKEKFAGKYDWLIVQHHKSTASVAIHLADKDIQAYVEAGFETLMSREKVDFVLAGHDHVYARSYPLEGKDDGKVSVPNKSFPAASGSIWNNPGNPVYLTFTTGSGLKYYQISVDKTFVWNATNSVIANTEYPYLGTTDAEGNSATKYGKDDYINGGEGGTGMLPVSTAAFMQPFIPSYCVVDVSSNSITFSTYAITTKTGTSGAATVAYNFDENVPYDKITVTKN